MNLRKYQASKTFLYKNLKIKYLRFDCDSYGLWLGMNDITVGGLMKKMDNILEQIFIVYH